MRIKRLETYMITIAEDVILTVTRVALGENNIFYEVTSGDTYHGKIFPARKDGEGLIWVSIDDIEPIFVKQIGKAIEEYQR